MSNKRCLWCRDENADYSDGTLCRQHQAELEGFSVSMLDRRDEIQHAEYLDSLN